MDPITALPPSHTTQSQPNSYQQRSFHNQTTKDSQYHQDTIQHRIRCGIHP
jgi:hypothetical protein